MAIPKTSIFEGITVQTPGVVKFLSIECDMETREKLGSTSEEFRWVVTVQTETTWGGLRSVKVKPGYTSFANLAGQMRGSPEFTIGLENGESALGVAMNFGSLFWRISREAIVGLNDDGSDQVALQQTWIAVTEWATAWWEA